MDLLGGWDRVRRNLVGTFFLQAKAELLESEVKQPPPIILQRQTCTVPISELEREYRELDLLDESLEQARNNYKLDQQQFELRWKQNSERTNLFQKFVLSFDEYFKVSSAKQQSDRRLNQKLEREVEEQHREVRRLKKQLDKMKVVKQELEKRLVVCSNYREFMQDVVEQSEFEYIGQVISRYHELKETRAKFVGKIVDQITVAFQLDNELQELVEDQKTQQVAGKTYLSELESYKSALRTSNWRRYDNLVALKEGLKRQLLMTHFPQKAVFNLYLLLCSEMGQPVELEQHEFKKQLTFIRKFLNELAKLSTRTKEFFECPSDVPLVSESVEKKRVI